MEKKVLIDKYHENIRHSICSIEIENNNNI